MAEKAPPSFMILDELPNGSRSASEASPLSKPIPPDREHEVLRAAVDAVLTVTGPQEKMATCLDPRSFEKALRWFAPPGHYGRAAIPAVEFKAYACRVAQRVLHALLGGAKPLLAGSYANEVAIDARAASVLEALLRVADEKHLRLQGEVNAPEARPVSEAPRSPPVADVEETVRQAVRAAEEKFRAEARDDLARQARELAEVKEGLRTEFAAALRARDEVEAARASQPAPKADVPQPTQAATETYAREKHEWGAEIEDDRIRKIFLHLEAHGSITEPEATTILGGPRAYRRFTVEVDAYLRLVPFRVRVEPGPQGSRYVREGEK